MRLLSFLPFLPASSAVYWYLEGAEKKCIQEDLPRDTMVVGHYKAEEYNPETQHYAVNPNLGIQITVEEMMDNYHRVVDTKGKSEGKFTFTTADTGDHEICFQTNAGNGWFSSSHVKFNLDLVVGHSDEFHQAGTEKVKDLARRIQDLNARLQDIKKEQIFQRVCLRQNILHEPTTNSDRSERLTSETSLRRPIQKWYDGL